MVAQPLILIGGPTASGKSARALEIATARKGSIINADAMQIYEGLPLLTAQPTAHDKGHTPHHLYEVLDPAEASSAGKWLYLAQKAIEEVADQGRLPILVGGTGLYFSALLGGLADIPSIPDAVRAEVSALYDDFGEANFRAKLALMDDVSAACLARNDRQRLIRAYEVVAHTGKTLQTWQRLGADKASHLNFAPEFHLMAPDRDELYARCDRRFEIMVEKGAIQEVERLLARKLDPSLPAMKILGVREFAAFLEGRATREDAISKAQQMTRNYAKRQLTWFRNQWRNKEFEKVN